MTKRRRLLWFEFCDHRRRLKPWRVFFVDRLPAGRPEDEGGTTDKIRREIELVASEPYDSILELLAHEMIHAMCPYRPNESRNDDSAEEYVAEYAETALVPILVSLGWKIPVLPEGFDALRRASKATS